MDDLPGAASAVGSTAMGPARRAPEPTTSTVLRDARPEDLVALQEVFRRSSLANELDRAILLQNPDALELSTPRARDRVRVAVVDGDIAGFVTARDLGDSLELVDLFVDPSCMRRGIGHALVEDARVQALAGGRARLVVTANPHALEFYRQEGFVADHDVETRFGPAPRMHLSVSR